MPIHTSVEKPAALNRVTGLNAENGEPPQRGEVCILLKRTAAGDRQAFELVYRQTAPVFFALALRITRNRNDAEEALQEAYFRVWKSASRFDPDKGNGLAWISTIIKNAALSLRRRRQRRQIGAQAYENELALIPDMGTTSDTFSVSSLSQARKLLDLCLRELDETKKTAIMLAYFEGLTHAELADRMQVPLGTAKSHIRRGLELIGRRLAADGLVSVNELIAGENELGVLPLVVSRGFEKRRAEDAKYCVAADRWREFFSGLLSYLTPEHPPVKIWKSLNRAVSQAETIVRKLELREKEHLLHTATASKQVVAE